MPIIWKYRSIYLHTSSTLSAGESQLMRAEPTSKWPNFEKSFQIHEPVDDSKLTSQATTAKKHMQWTKHAQDWQDPRGDREKGQVPSSEKALSSIPRPFKPHPDRCWTCPLARLILVDRTQMINHSPNRWMSSLSRLRAAEQGDLSGRFSSRLRTQNGHVTQKGSTILTGFLICSHSRVDKS